MIPDGWNRVRLGDHVKIHSGYAPASLVISDNGTVPYIKVDDLNNCTRIQMESKVKARFKGRKVPKNTILFPKRGAAIMNNKVRIAGTELILDTNMMGLEARPTLDPWFSYYWLVNEQLFKIADTSTIPQINNKHINPLSITLPPLPEQKKIAEILTTWDKAIEATEKLLANAEAQKRALMRQLLDEPSWPRTKIADLGTIRSAGVDKKEVEGEKAVRLLNYVDVLRRDRIFSDELDHWVTAPDRQVDNCDIKKGDVFFTPSSETREDIGHSAVAAEDIPDAAYSYHIVRFRPSVEMDLAFSAYAFKSRHFYRQCYSYCEGSGQRYVISQDYFRSFDIGFPPIDQQRKIGQIISNCDEIVAHHRQDIAFLRAEKRALMQQLLTGRKRVKV